MGPLTTIIQQTPFATVVCSALPPFRITHANEVIAKWVSKHSDALLGQPLQAAINPYPSEWLALINEVITKGQTQRKNGIIMQWPDDQTRQITIVCFPLADLPTQSPAQILSYLIDVIPVPSTSRSPDPLSLDQIASTFVNVPIPLWIFDLHGNIHSVNDATLQLFQVTSFDQFVGIAGANINEMIERLQPRITTENAIAQASESSISAKVADPLTHVNSDHIWESDRRRSSAEKMTRNDLNVARVLQRRSAIPQLVSFVHPLREAELIIRSTAAPLLQNGQMIGAVYVTDDVTASALSHGQRDAILAISGHDLRNPLTPARIHLQQLQRRLTKAGNFERELDDIHRINEQLRRIQQIADDLDAIAASARGETASILPRCDIVELAQEVIARQLARHPLTPVVFQSAVPSIVGTWGRRHLERVLSMLLANAGLRSPPDGTITVRIRLLRTTVRVEITEQGELLTPEQLDIVQSTLRQGSAALSTYTAGGDLDLSVVQTLLGLYRSRLNISSKPRQGTIYSFSMQLPQPEPTVK